MSPDDVEPVPPLPTDVERDLRNVRFRPIEPGDLGRLQQFHQRLSAATVVQRFHGAKRELSVPLAERLTNLDRQDAVGLVATTGSRGRIIAVGRFARLDEHRAEVAFVVEDAYQRHGLGRRLMRRLRAQAIQDGITTLVAEVLPGNTGMIRLMESAGTLRSTVRHGAVHIEVDLAGTDRS